LRIYYIFTALFHTLYLSCTLTLILLLGARLMRKCVLSTIYEHGGVAFESLRSAGEINIATTTTTFTAADTMIALGEPIAFLA
jgi:hypothetical protein